MPSPSRSCPSPSLHSSRSRRLTNPNPCARTPPQPSTSQSMLIGAASTTPRASPFHNPCMSGRNAPMQVPGQRALAPGRRAQEQRLLRPAPPPTNLVANTGRRLAASTNEAGHWCPAPTNASINMAPTNMTRCSGTHVGYTYEIHWAHSIPRRNTRERSTTKEKEKPRARRERHNRQCSLRAPP